MQTDPNYSARYPSLNNRRVFITGGASGIGACLVERFVEQGAQLAFVDRDAEAAAALMASLTSSRQPWFRALDVSDADALQAAIRDAADAFGGGVDVLVNNVGDDTRHAYAELTADDWDRIQAINLRAHFFAIQAAAPLMSDGASIINLGSVSWKRRRKGFIGYVTAKGGIHALTRSMAQELGTLGIRVNAVVPGAILTERQQRLWVDADFERALLEEQALKFRLVPDDVAAMILFLAADDSRACSGQEFIVDGGIV